MRATRRISAALAGAALSALALWCAAWVLLAGAIAGSPPDTTVVDGDPCCPTPDSWGQVVTWGGASALLSALVALALAIGLSCLTFAQRGRWPRTKNLISAPSAAAALVCVALAVAQIAQAVS